MRRLSWLVEDAFVPLVKLHPAVNEVIPVSARRWRREFLSPRACADIGAFAARLRSHQYDKIVDTQGLAAHRIDDPDRAWRTPRL